MIEKIIIQENNIAYTFIKDHDKWVVNTALLVKHNDQTSKARLTTPSKARLTHKRNISKDNKRNIAETSSAEIFNFNLLKEKMLSSKDIRMIIISLYWTYKKIEFENKEQYSAGLKRELRASNLLKGYSIERIKEVMFYLNGEEFLNGMWTLETVHKYIDRDLTKLKK